MASSATAQRGDVVAREGNVRDNEVNIGLLHPQRSCFGTNDMNFNNSTGSKTALIYLKMLFNCQLVWEKTKMLIPLFSDPTTFCGTVSITTSETAHSKNSKVSAAQSL